MQDEQTPGDEFDPTIPQIDLTDEVNANWRDILRKDPNDPRFRYDGPPLNIVSVRVPPGGFKNPGEE